MAFPVVAGSGRTSSRPPLVWRSVTVAARQSISSKPSWETSTLRRPRSSAKRTMASPRRIEQSIGGSIFAVHQSRVVHARQTRIFKGLNVQQREYVNFGRLGGFDSGL